MTAPLGSGRTANFALPFLAVGQPAYQTRDLLEAFAREVDAALTRGPASPPAAQDLTAVAGRVTKLEPTAWTALPLLNGATRLSADFRAPQYRKAGDVVELRGILNGATATQPFGQLPAGFRPVESEVLHVISDNSPGNVYVKPDGTLQRPVGVGWLSLSGLRFSLIN